MIDVHCHLNFRAFENDYDGVAKRAFDAGVTKIINVGTQVSSSKRAVTLASQHENFYAIVGVHPHHADKVELGSNWIDEIEELAKKPKVVAIGEIGMDNYRYQSNGIVDPVTQQEIFEKQIELAHKLKLPLQIHNRHAGKEILEILNHHKSSLLTIPGMFHCMSGDVEFLKHVLDLGFYVGFDGNSTYKGLAPGETTTLTDLIKATPLDRIVLETDSPYLSPIPFRGQRNEPKNVIIVLEFVSQTKGLSPQEISSTIIQNVQTLFGI